MNYARRALLVSLICLAGCGGGGGGGGGGGSPPAPPPPPPLATITGPSSTLPAASLNVPFSPTSFTGTGTAPFGWTVTAGSTPPGITLSGSGVYSGTPITPGSYSFTVTLTDANGTASAGFAQIVLASVAESEPNNTAGTSDLLPTGGEGTGTLGTNDVDFWSFSAAANDIVEIELFGTRSDFSTWDTNQAIPKVSLIGTNGTSFLLGHDRSVAFVTDTFTGWQWGTHDMDLPRFRVPAAGTYFLRIEPDIGGSPGGDYAVRVNFLSLGSIQAEVEGNDTPGTATFITPGTIRGFHADEDLDFYSFTVTEPTIVNFEVFAYRNGVAGNGGTPDDDYFDPQLVIVNPTGTTGLSGNDDCFFYDSAVNFLIVNPGTYFVLVYESNFQTAGDADYFLTYSATPVGSTVDSESGNDTTTADAIAYGDIVSGFADLGAADVDMFSFTGTAGDVVRVFWNDLGTHETAADFVDLFLMVDDSTALPQTYSFWGQVGQNCVRATLPADGTYYVRVAPYGGATLSTDYTFQLVLLKQGTFETESNDTPGTADAIPVGNRVAGVIDSSSDVDVYSFTALAGEVVTFSIYAGPPGPTGSNGFVQNFAFLGTAELAPDLEVVTSVGTVLAATDYFGNFCTGESITNGSATSEITFVAPSAGTFYVRVSSADGTGSAEHIYLLEKR